MTAHVIHDQVLGTHSISESVLIDLLQSSAITRLQGIHQSGGTYLVRASRGTSRYDHVVGVMLLIRLLGGSLKEQIAGLMHDVSHTAFSHVVDQVFQRRAEDYHEQHFRRLVLNSDIPEILEQYGISLEEIFDMEQWSLLDQPLPDLCADRIDYTLRDLFHMGYISFAEIENFLDSLRVYHGKIVCGNLQAAVWFTHQYAIEVGELFMNPLEIYANDQLAQAIRTALAKDVLDEDDLFLQDEDLIQRLQSASDPDITRYLSRLHPGIQVVEDKRTFDIHAYSKARIVDPLVLMENGSVVRCSELEPSIKNLHNKVMQKAQQGVFVRFIPATP
jgi:uncharacterized protein